ncbi:MAG: phage holin family protein [Clostridia bacterium]|nr:phage holin family protein [Clostridia bacterium]
MKRIGLAFFSCLLTVPLCVQMLPGITAEPMENAILAGALLGFAWLLLRPLLRLLTFPIGCLTLGISGFITDCALIWLMAYLIPGFEIQDLFSLALAALLVDGVCLIAGGGK